jgi:hypothetical protein
MHWSPDPKMRSPTPGKRGARYSHGGACDGSLKKLYHFGLSEATIFDGNAVGSLAGVTHFTSAPTR